VKPDIESIKSMLASASDDLLKSRSFNDYAIQLVEEALSMACSLSVELAVDTLMTKFTEKGTGE